MNTATLVGMFKWIVAAEGDEKQRRLRIVIATGLVVLLAFVLTTCAGCATSVPDPEVRAASFDVVSALKFVADSNESPDLVKQFAVLALERANVFEEKADKLSDLDKEKVGRLKQGIQSIIDRSGESGYVRARALSLQSLAGSIGQFHNEAVGELLEDAKTLSGKDQPQTQPEKPKDGQANDGGGNPPAGSETDGD